MLETYKRKGSEVGRKAFRLHCRPDTHGEIRRETPKENWGGRSSEQVLAKAIGTLKADCL